MAAKDRPSAMTVTWITARTGRRQERLLARLASTPPAGDDVHVLLELVPPAHRADTDEVRALGFAVAAVASGRAASTAWAEP